MKPLIGINLNLLEDFYEKIKDNTADVMRKIVLLQESAPASGLAIVDYPVGIPFNALKKINESIYGYSSLEEKDFFRIQAPHDSEFILTKIGSQENEMVKKAILNSMISIFELGYFIIAEVQDGLIVSKTQYMSYRTTQDLI